MSNEEREEAAQRSVQAFQELEQRDEDQIHAEMRGELIEDWLLTSE